MAWRRQTPTTESPSSGLESEEQLRLLLAEDPERGWQTFIDAYTPALLALVERAGIVDHDEAMEVYVRACERLSANDCAALRRRDSSIGSLGGWLAVVVKRAAVDWIRSRIGRRRIFAAVRDLDGFHQRLFELFYWEGRRPTEAAERLRIEMKQDVELGRVFDALERIDGVLTARHRGELVSMLARSRGAIPLDAADDEPGVDPPADLPDPEAQLRAREREAHLARALATLPPEDAVIVSLKFVEGLTRPQIQSFLRLPELTEHRVRTIVAALRVRLAAAEPADLGPRDQPQSMRTMPGVQDA